LQQELPREQRTVQRTRSEYISHAATTAYAYTSVTADNRARLECHNDR